MVLSGLATTAAGRHARLRVLCGITGWILYEGDRMLMASVHRLVLETFVGPPPAGCQACHNNGDCHDNRVQNLRWGTAKENALDVNRHGRRTCGEKHHAHVITEDDVVLIRRLKAEGRTANSIANQLGLYKQVVLHVVNGKTWKHVA